MNFYLKTYPDALRQLFVSTTPAETNEIFDTAVLKIQKNFSLQGYRKGKVPTDIIVKTNPPELMNIVSELMMDKALVYLQELNTSFYGQPRFNPLNGLSRDKEFSFSLVFEVYPILHKTPDLKTTIEFESCEIEQSFLEETLCRQIGLVENVSGTIKDTDLVQVIVLNTDYSGEKKEAAFDASKLSVLVGKNTGDTLDIAFDDLSGYLPEFLGKVSNPLKVEIKELSRAKQWSTVTDEEIAERTPFKTKAEYLETTQKQLEDLSESYNNSQKATAISNQLSSQIEVEIPKSLWLTNLRDQTLKTAEQDIIKEEISLNTLEKQTSFIDKFSKLPTEARQGIAFIIWLDEYAKQEKLTVDAQELEYTYYKYAQQHKTTLENFKKNLRAEDKESIKFEVLREKAMSHLISQMTFKSTSTISISTVLKKNR